MSATEELRRLLDERGVEWYEPTMKPNTTWLPDAHGFNCRVTPWGNALCVKRYGLTPEQAIAATLGGGERTCRVARTELYGQMRAYIHEFSCDCGQRNFFTTNSVPPKHCPNCGAKVVEE